MHACLLHPRKHLLHQLGAPPGGTTASASHGCMPGMKTLRVATECSGLEPLPHILDRIGMKGRYQMVWACEPDNNCRDLIRSKHKGNALPQWFHHDITRRKPDHIPDHDLYVVGFPHHPFYTLGPGECVQDTLGRGSIVDHVLAGLHAKTPRAFILEDVRGLVLRHDAFSRLIDQLQTMHNQLYFVDWKVLNTEHHGIPQHRERVYIIGVRKDVHRKRTPFKWPEQIKPKSLRTFLDKDKPLTRVEQIQRVRTFVKGSPCGIQRKLKSVWSLAKRDNIAALDLTNPIIMDVDGTKCNYMVGRCPCITRSRGSARFFLPSRGRRLSLAEILRLQGLPTSILRHQGKISDRHLGAMVGNAMSGNVLERILARLLPACGFAEASLRDPWCP
jgi:DNA (cytosine-5)-methyltransferase 1